MDPRHGAFTQQSAVAAEIGAEVRTDALGVLSDVPQWHLSEQHWQYVGAILDLMATALTTGDDTALQRAVLDLELISPLRVARLGAKPLLPAPIAIRLRRNRLVHSLGADDAPTLGLPTEDDGLTQLWSSRIGTTVDSGGALHRSGGIREAVEQELVVHLFAPLDGPLAQRAYQQIRDLWTGCRRVYAVHEPIPGMNLPHDIPEAHTTVPATQAIAAQQNAGASVQVILRREHDVLNLSVLSACEPDGSGPSWVEQNDTWDTVAASGTDALLGAARLYLGKVLSESPPPLVATADVASRLAASLPGASLPGAELPGADDQWYGDGATVAGFAVWELTPRDEARAERRVVVVAPPGGDPHLSAWTWSRGDPAMTPFTQYLLHAAKVRYELRLWQRSEPNLRPRDAIATSEGSLVTTITDLRDMRLTVEIARSNMAAVLGPAVSDVAVLDGLVGDDRALTDWFTVQLGDDLTYLENARERAAYRGVPADSTSQRASPLAVHASPTFGIVTALPEEFVAMRAMIDAPTAHPVANDPADYVLGSIPSAEPDRPHPVVLTLLGETGNDAAAEAVAHLLRSFGSVDQVLMVGIACGMPAPDHPDRHVRLGDIVVGTWGIVDFDHIVDKPGGPELRQGFPLPSALLARRAKMLDARDKLNERPWEPFLDRIETTLPSFARPPADTDRLFANDGADADQVPHPDHALSGHRPGRPKVHYGRIGSSERSLRNAASRDALAARYDMRAIEMESKGIGTASFSNRREWFVVRGVSDYGDSRADRVWRHYASAVAAAYVRALLTQCQPLDVHQGRSGADTRRVGR